MQKIIEEIIVERARQEAKWGQQNHPIVDRNLSSTWAAHPEITAQNLALHYGVPTEENGKSRCENSFKDGSGTYMHIIVEELAEAVGAKTRQEMRVELIQTAACVIAAIESMDREDAKEVK